MKILTNDAKSTLYVLYKEYYDRRKHGFSKSFSRSFGSAQEIQSDYFPDSLLEDVEDNLRELGRNDFLINFYADDTIYTCDLSDYAISTIENQTKDCLVNIATFLSKFVF